jgi:hypothetical protein
MQEVLMTALKERIAAGYSEATIVSEMMAIGYTKADAESAYALASGGMVAGSASTVLPTVTEYIEQVWELAKEEMPVLGKTILVGVGAFVLVAFSVFTVSNTQGFGVSSSFWTTALIVPLIAAFVAGVMTLALTRALLLRHDGALFRTHVTFIVVNFFSLAMVTLYLTILTQVGYMFFVIPGIMAAVYFMFAMQVAVAGEAKGVAALLRSVELVYGRFFAVLVRFVVLNIITMATVFVFAFVLSLLTTGAVAQGTAFGMTSFPILFVGVIGAVVAAVYFMSCGSVVLFETLRQVPSPSPIKEGTLNQLRRLFLVVLTAVIGLLCLVAFGLGFAGYTFFL